MSLDRLAPYRWALNELGQREIPGRRHNMRIVYYHSFTTLGAVDDETSWCSSFICAAAEETGHQSTRSAAARSWLSYGTEVSLADAAPGDICVFWRGSPNSWMGHVTFIHEKWDGKSHTIKCLGGNQSNAVTIEDYPLHQLLSVRRFPGEIGVSE